VRLPITRRILRRLAPFCLALCCTSPRFAAAEDGLLYKCRKPDGGTLYSNIPCAEQKAKSVKVMRTDRAQIGTYEMHLPKPSPSPAPNLMRSLAGPGTIPRYVDDADGVPQRPLPAASAARPAGDESWWSRLRRGLLGWNS